MLLHFVFLCSVICWKRISAAKNLKHYRIILQLFSKASSKRHLEHVPPELLLLGGLLPEQLEAELAEVRVVDEAAAGDLVGDVEQLLVARVQPQHLHPALQILARFCVDHRYPFLYLNTFGSIVASLRPVSRERNTAVTSCRSKVDSVGDT